MSHLGPESDGGSLSGADVQTNLAYMRDLTEAASDAARSRREAMGLAAEAAAIGDRLQSSLPTDDPAATDVDDAADAAHAMLHRLRRQANPKRTAMPKARSATALVKRCRRLWDAYCRHDTKGNLLKVKAHLDKMAESDTKSVKAERRKCLRVFNAEWRAKGYKAPAKKKATRQRKNPGTPGIRQKENPTTKIKTKKAFIEDFFVPKVMPGVEPHQYEDAWSATVEELVLYETLPKSALRWKVPNFDKLGSGLVENPHRSRYKWSR